jgi:ferredoxin
VKIRVDYRKCSGHGLCEGIAKDVFEVGQDRQVHLLREDLDEARRSDMQEAVDECPTQALSISDGC